MAITVAGLQYIRLPSLLRRPLLAHLWWILEPVSERGASSPHIYPFLSKKYYSFSYVTAIIMTTIIIIIMGPKAWATGRVWWLGACDVIHKDQYEMSC